MAKLAPPNRRRAKKIENSGSSTTYAMKETKYASSTDPAELGDIRKHKERTTFVALFDVAQSYGSGSSAFILDAESMEMTKCLVSFFGDSLKEIHITNPEAWKMEQNSGVSHYPRLHKAGAQLFSLMTYEFTDIISKLVRTGT